MLFNSIDFLVFLTAFFLLWPVVRRSRNARFAYLVCASFIFYGWWQWQYLFLIVGSGLLDYGAAWGMRRKPRFKKAFLLISIVGNIGSLAIFKYLDFLILNCNWIGGFFGDINPIPAAELLLPIGISFYTFQSMSYTIDVYRGRLAPTGNILHFFAYLSLFPQLVAGPIVRAAELLPQLNQVNPVSQTKQWRGLRLIVLGYFKKMVIADSLAPLVNAAWNSPDVVNCSAYWWLIMLMFAYQIYCDFSGYSDIARGLAKWMGYEFPLNFNHPYIASSVREFWGRWHISLSTWFRDYVYIPLGGSQRGMALGMRNMWITMVLSGFWHGAHWAFVMWGVLHAFYLTVERVTRWPDRLKRLPAGKTVSTLVTFVLVLLAWVFFRSGSVNPDLVAEGGFARALSVLATMFNFGAYDSDALSSLSSDPMPLLFLGCIFARQLYFLFGLDRKHTLEGSRVFAVFDQAAMVLMIVACVYFRGQGSAFIYFQF